MMYYLVVLTHLSIPFLRHEGLLLIAYARNQEPIAMITLSLQVAKS